MRVSPLAILTGLTALVSANSDGLAPRAEIDVDDLEPPKPPTIFNSITVPPALELTEFNYDEEIKKSRWLLVKHFSPYCPHCIDFAPTFQTLYEYYYTSKPDGEDFTKYYDFRFASLNCVAFQDLCTKLGVTTYPWTILYENGERSDHVRGAKNINAISKIVETALEKTKPGSRPKDVKMPAPGDTEFPKKEDIKKAEEELRSPTANDVEEGSTEKTTEKTTEKSSDKSSEKSTDKTSDKTSEKSSEKKSKDESSEKKEKKPSSSTEKTGKKEKTTSKDKADDTEEDTWPPKKWKAPTSAEVFNNRKVKKPSSTPNTAGTSVALTAESFQKQVTMTQDPWFIKFYAPWCPHCQAMGATWNQLAKNMQGKLNIGEVNCDIESRLCKDVNARAYPTIVFFKGGERAEYQGLRGLGDFVNYADKALDLAGGIPDVDAKTLEAMEKKDEVIFVYFYDHATTSEDFNALERIPLSLIGHAKLVKTNDPELCKRFKITTWPRLLVSREGRPTYYTPLTPDSMRNPQRVLDWMRSAWLPLVPELTATNARQVMDGKIVVLGILNREDQDGFQGALREMKSAANEWMDRQIQEFQLERKKLRDAKQMRIEEAEDRDDQRALRSAKAIHIDMNNSGRKEVAFAWVDGVFWQRWIRTTYGVDSTSGERVIVNDQDARQYWDTTVTGNYIMVSRTAISESLDKIVYGPQVLKPKLAVSIFEKVILDIRVTLKEHPYLSSGCIIGVLFGLFTIFKGRFRRARNGYFKLDDTMGSLKDGILGQNGNAKAD